MANNWKYWTGDMAETWAVGAPLPAHADMFKVEFLNQFVDAINERMDAAVWSADRLPEIVAGDDVQTAALWNLLFERVTRCVTRFVDSGLTTLSGHVVPNVGGESRIGYAAIWWGYLSDLTLTLNERFAVLLAAAGITGIRRSTDGYTFTLHSDLDAHDFYVQVGDVIGPWLFEDMRAILHVLLRTSWGVAGSSSSRWHGAQTSTPAPTSCADARSEAAASWAFLSAGGSTSLASIMGFVLIQQGYDNPPGTPRFSASGSITSYSLTKPAHAPAGMTVTYFDYFRLGSLTDILLPGYGGYDNTLFVVGSSASSVYAPPITASPTNVWDATGYQCPPNGFKSFWSIGMSALMDWTDHFQYT